MDVITLFVLVIFTLEIIKESAAVNVALGQVVFDCKDESLSRVIVDGSTDQLSSITVAPCDINNSIRIVLNGSYQVHFVVVYEGKNPNPSMNQLDYFEVELINIAIWTCGQFHSKSYGPSQPMRVNCQTSANLTEEVRVITRDQITIYLSEVEVHTLTSGKEKEKLFKHRGCFVTFSTSIIVLNDPIIENCHEYCLLHRKLFFGIKNMECYCADTIIVREEIPESFCDQLCSSMMCGGANYFSVYIAMLLLPTYYGCYSWQDELTNPRVGRNMTLSSCITRCSNFHFALLKDGNTCFCKDDGIGSGLEMYNACDKRCSGFNRFFCGGTTHVSVYRTCKSFADNSTSCDDFLNCAQEMDINGVCLGVCKEYFQGAYCFEKSGSAFTTVSSPTSQTEKCQVDQCKYFPNTDCIVENNEAICKCKPGFQKTSKGFCLATNKTDEDKVQGGSLPLFIIIPMFCLIVVGGICCLRSSAVVRLHQPVTSFSIVNRGFTFSAPSVWNAFPPSVSFGSSQMHEDEVKLRASQRESIISSKRASTSTVPSKSTYTSKTYEHHGRKSSRHRSKHISKSVGHKNSSK